VEPPPTHRWGDACPSGRYDEIGSAASSTSTCRLH